MPRSKASPTHITSLDVEPLNVALIEPFTIATGALTAVRNVLVRVTLAGWTASRDLPTPPDQTFREWWAQR